MLEQLLEQKVGARGAFTFNDSRQRIHPLPGFLRVLVLRVAGNSNDIGGCGLWVFVWIGSHFVS